MKIIIQEFQESWAEEFLKLRKIIQSALNNFDISIDHIGSTSVKGLGAKPIIDILIGVENESELDLTILPMQQNGFTYHKRYERASEKWTAMPERRYYIRLVSLTDKTPPLIIDFDDKISSDFVTLSNIHTLVKNSNGWKRHIAFRDFIRTHTDVRDEYYNLKKEISKQEFEDGLKYNEAKNDFVKDVEKRALTWYDNIGEQNKKIKTG